MTDTIYETSFSDFQPLTYSTFTFLLRTLANPSLIKLNLK